jgi:hypothetical protein
MATRGKVDNRDYTAAFIRRFAGMSLEEQNGVISGLSVARDVIAEARRAGTIAEPQPPLLAALIEEDEAPE